MLQIDLYRWRELFLKYWKYVAIVVLIIAIISQCNRSKGLISDANTHKADAEKYLSQARVTQSHLQGLTAKYDAKIDSVVKIEKSYKLQLIQNSKTVNTKLGQIRHYSTTDNTNYFKDRYNETTNVIQVENGTTLKDTVTKKVITDLIVGDGAKAEVKILRNEITTKDNKFNICNNTVDSLKLGIKAVSENYEKANLEKDKAILDTEKAFKRERNKKNLWKIITGAVIAGSGYLLFVK